MIEEIQDKIASLLTTYLPTELAALTTVDSVALTLTSPQKYAIAFDPKSTILAAGDYPFCGVLTGKTVLSDQLSVGVQIQNEHSIALVFLLVDQNIENLERMKSRYSKAAVIVLKEHQQDSPLRRVKINQIVYARTLRDEKKSSYLGSVWLLFDCWEREVL